MAKTTEKWIERTWGVDGFVNANSFLVDVNRTITQAIVADELKLSTLASASASYNSNYSTVASNSANWDSAISGIEWGAIDGLIENQTDLNETFIKISEKGVESGVAPLDSLGKIPSTYLYSSVMDYKGAWNATTNSPQLSIGEGDNGDMYRVSVSGSQDLGEGSKNYYIGDLVIYTSLNDIWQRIPGSENAGGTITSVNGYFGPSVTLTKSDIELSLVDNVSVCAHYVPITRKVFGSALSADILSSAITVSQSGVVLGRLTAGSGSIEEIKIGTSAYNLVQLNSDAKISSGLLDINKFTSSFTSGQLVNDEITFNHNLNDDWPLIGIYDQNKKWVIPTDIISVSPSATLINTFGINVYGTWNVKIFKG